MSNFLFEGRLGCGEFNIDNIISRNNQERESITKLENFLKSNNIQYWHCYDGWVHIDENPHMNWFRGGYEGGIHERSRNMPNIEDSVVILDKIGFIGGSNPTRPSEAIILKVKNIEHSIGSEEIFFYPNIVRKEYFFNEKLGQYSWYAPSRYKRFYRKYLNLIHLLLIMFILLSLFIFLILRIIYMQAK